MVKKLSDDLISWKLSLNATGVQGEINKVSSVIRELEKDNIALSKSIKDAEKQMKESERTMDKLSKAGKENSKAFQNAKSLYQEAAEDISELNKRISENNRSLDENRKQLKAHEADLKLNEMTMLQLQRRASDLKDKLAETSASANPKEYKELGKDLKAVENQMVELGDKNKNLIEQFAGMHNPVGSAAQAVLGFGQAIKKLMTSNILLTAIILAVLAVFYLFKNAITGSDEAATKFEGVMAALNSVLDTGKRILVEFLSLLKNLVTLDFKGMKENVQNMADMGRQMTENAASAYEAAIAEDALNDAIARNNDITKVNQARISELRQITQDTTKSLEERKKASEELLKLERDNYKMAISNISGQYEVWKGKNKNLIDAMRRDSNAQFEEVEKYMKMVQEGTELTFEQRTQLANLVNDITTTLDRGTEEQKEKFRSFFSEMSEMQQTYFDGSRRDAKNANKIEEDARKEREEAARKYTENQIKKNEAALQKQLNLLKRKRADGLLTEEEYNKRVEEETRKSLEKQTKIRGIGNDKILSIQSQLLDAEVERQQQMEKILNDSQITIDIETKAYNDRLKKFGLYGLEMDKMTETQLRDRLALDKEYHAELQKIALEAENTRFKQAQEAAGVSEKSEGEQKKVYERLEQQHQANVQKIKDDSAQKQKDIQKQLDAALLKSIQEAGKASVDAVDAAETGKILQLKQSLSEKLITQNEYEKELKNIEATALAERLTAQDAYVQKLKDITNPTDEQKKALEAAEAAVQATQAKIYDNKINEEKTYQDRRKAAIEHYGLETRTQQYDAEMAALRKQYDDGILTLEEYEKAKLLLKLDYAQQYVNQVGDFVQAGSDLVKSIEEAETANTQAQYAERHTALKEQLDNGIISQEEYNAEKEQLDYEQRVAELEVQKKYADANFAMQVAQIGVATATGIVNAWASAMTIPPPFGEIAAGALTAILLGTAAAQTASANAERKRVKALTIEAPSGSSGGSDKPKTGAVMLKDKPGGFADGGYTGDGDKYEIAGFLADGRPFHRGEYFIAQEEMAHPAVVPMVRAIESIRRRRTDKNPLPVGFADGGYTQPNGQGGNYVMIDEKLVVRFEKAVDKFEKTKLPVEINYWEWKEVEEKMDKTSDLTKK